MRFIPLAAFALTLSACGDATGTSARAGGARSGSPAARLVGTWVHQHYFTSGGDTHLSETWWTFRAGGSATRSLLTTNLTDGIYDRIDRAAAWSADGRTLEIRYTDAPAEVQRFAYELAEPVLTIGSSVFIRAVP